MRAGHLGRIDVLSRRGLSPLAHPAKPEDVPLAVPFKDESVRGVVRELRAAAKAAGERWPGVIDAFRSEIHRIWGAWDYSERSRFLRHARTFWETHRHRVAPDVYREWDLYRRGGKIRIEAGRLASACVGRDGFDAEIARRSGGAQKRRYDRIVNCTGAAPDLTLFADHGYREDPLGLGLPTDALGRPLSPNGSADPAVYVVGPALRSRFWEMTAVPDLRVQAKAVADALVAELG